MEVTLKEASLLCRKSEKTLRRKIEAGLLEGRKEPLEFGGFMWLIDMESLEELYPGSKPSQLPQVYNSPEPPQVRLRTRAINDDSLEGLPITNALVPDGSELCEDDDEDEDDEPWGVRQSFLNYILEENRGLKLEIKERDARILGLNERAMVLERALGEQEGKATTQARVLEWFQSQESEREKARGENERKLLEAAPAANVPTKAPYLAGLVGAIATAVLLLAFAASGLITFG